MSLGSYLRRLIAVGRGLRWYWHRRIKAAEVPAVLGSGTLFVIEKGGQLVIGKGCSFDRDVEVVVYRGGSLVLGDHVYIGHGTTISCSQSVQIGSDTLVGDLVGVRDMNHRRVPGVPLRLSGTETRPVRIGENCWLGSKVTFVAGAEVGNQVAVAANAVVTGKFGDGMTIGGAPARPLQHSAEVIAS